MEKKYYYIDSRGTQFGPLTLDELLGAGITPTTYVWRAGMKEWKMAKDVLEIAEQMQTPPMAGAPQPAYNNPMLPPGRYRGYHLCLAGKLQMGFRRPRRCTPQRLSG